MTSDNSPARTDTGVINRKTLGDAGVQGTRREFLHSAALATLAMTLPWLGACEDELVDPSARATLDLSNDTGVLNFYYALAQLQADFYARVNTNRFAGITTVEATAFTAIGNHATAHRNFLMSYIQDNRITDLLFFRFGSEVDFSNHASVMGAAQLIEDTAAQSYIGTLGRLSDPERVTIAAKIASLIARRAAVIRDFSDVAAASSSRTRFAGDDLTTDDVSGLERFVGPREALAALGAYFETELEIRNA